LLAREIIDAIKKEIIEGRTPGLDELMEVLETRFPGTRLTIPWIGLQRAQAREELGITEKMDDVTLGIAIKPRTGLRGKEPVKPARIETEEELSGNVITIVRAGVVVSVAIGKPADMAVEEEGGIILFARMLVEKYQWLKLPQFLPALADLLSRKYPYNGARSFWKYEDKPIQCKALCWTGT